ncbi:MAG: tetratricopeptide repeat protein [Chloroflexi bacterium]|nr:tetratricopeptide repeat protein [Chloroflexota bacterium]
MEGIGMRGANMITAMKRSGTYIKWILIPVFIALALAAAFMIMPMKIIHPKRPPEPDVLQSVMTYNQKAAEARDRGDFKTAIQYVEKSLKEASYLPEKYPEKAMTLSFAGETYYIAGQADKGKPLLLSALKIQEKKQDTEYALSLFRMAELERRESRLREALPYMQKSFEARLKFKGSTYETAYTASSVGIIQKDLGLLNAALKSFNRAKEIMESIYSPDDPKLSDVYYSLNELYCDMKDYKKAEEAITRALDIDVKANGGLNPKVVRDLNDLALLQLTRKEYGPAEKTCRRSIDIIKGIGPDKFGENIIVYSFEPQLYLARALLAKGDKKGAVKEMTRVHDILDRLSKSDHPTRVDQQTMFGMALDTVSEMDLLSGSLNKKQVDQLKKYIYEGDFKKADMLMDMILKELETGAKSSK